MNPALQEVMCDTWGHFYLTEGFKVNNIQLGGSSPQAVITKHPQIRHSNTSENKSNEFLRSHRKEIELNQGATEMEQCTVV